MKLTEQIAKHFRDVHFGGNWTSVNLKTTLADVDWKQATTRVHSFNTIASLVYHSNYFVKAILKVLQGGPLDAHDKYSFDVPPIDSQEAWEKSMNGTLEDAENLAVLIAHLPEEKLDQFFIQEKYGTYFRNLFGVIEHTHYHLGQIVLIKKLLTGVVEPHRNIET